MEFPRAAELSQRDKERKEERKASFALSLLPVRTSYAAMLQGKVLFKNPKIFQNKEQSGGIFSSIKNTE